MNKYPQVGKTGVDALHGSWLPTDVLYHERNVICKYVCVMMTEI
jgi:hypothetical protein